MTPDPPTQARRQVVYWRLLAAAFGQAEHAPNVEGMAGELADEVGLPGDPEFRAAFVGYVEWGTRLAVHNSGESTDVVEQAPVPRWGWGVAPPYQP